MGSYSDSGWWHYFPIAFLLKTPLPTLLLLALAVFWYLRLTIDDLRLKCSSPMRISTQSAIQNPQSAIFLLLPALGYFAIALTTDINLGYRHLLPILPFLTVFIAATLPHSQFTIHNSQFTIRFASFSIIWLLGNRPLASPPLPGLLQHPGGRAKRRLALSGGQQPGLGARFGQSERVDG
jgi:hypothetical protein